MSLPFLPIRPNSLSSLLTQSSSIFQADMYMYTALEPLVRPLSGHAVQAQDRPMSSSQARRGGESLPPPPVMPHSYTAPTTSQHTTHHIGRASLRFCSLHFGGK